MSKELLGSGARRRFYREGPKKKFTSPSTYFISFFFFLIECRILPSIGFPHLCYCSRPAADGPVLTAPAAPEDPCVSGCELEGRRSVG